MMPNAPHFDGDIEQVLEQDEINLSGADLSGACLSGVDLSGADLSEANLSWADLSEAKLSEANLSWANLSEVDLSDAYLTGADLSWANLSHANLKGVNLFHADLSNADLKGADLRSADLDWTFLTSANLKGADLTGADVNLSTISLIRTNVTDVKYNDLVPEKGVSFTAYKATRNHIVKVKIPADAERVNPIGSKKCRAERVRTLEILDENGETCDKTVVCGLHDGTTVYEEGEITKADSFDGSLTTECTHGIHFFMKKEQAIEWLRNA